MRRLALVLGGGALATTLVVSVMFGGMGLGGLLPLKGRPGRVYGALELGAAAWALALPVALARLPTPTSLPGQIALVAGLVGPPAIAMGATLPALALAAGPLTGGLYAANTLGALLGCLAVPWLLLPIFGVDGSSWIAAGLAAAAGVGALRVDPEPAAELPRGEGAAPLVDVAVSGFVAMALELAWTRLGAVLLGPSLHALAMVLAIFLAGVALGALLPIPRRHALGALGALALLGSFAWGQAPLWLAVAYDVGGSSILGVAGAALTALCMAGAPVASGAVLGRALAEAPARAGALYGANTLAGVLGTSVAGLWALPTLGLHGVVSAAAALAALASRKPAWILITLGLALAAPRWDGKLHAVGLYHRLAELEDRSPSAVARWAAEGWSLLYYEQGRTAAVAVGRSDRTGNVWLSINGKVDASTGDDMPTQELSAQIPIRVHGAARRVLVVGLASGVSAGRALAEPGVEALTVVELEPRVVEASHFFDHVNGRPLEDPRTTLLVQDARAVLAAPGAPYDVIISEPSNPWITGVSNLFTREYWELGKARLAPGGVFCQWMQLYGLRVSEMRTVVATFASVFPQTWLFQTIEGADVLLVGSTGEVDLGASPIAATLDPDGVARLGRFSPLNTDNWPRVELRAPGAMHLATAEANEAAIATAASGR